MNKYAQILRIAVESLASTAPTTSTKPRQIHSAPPSTFLMLPLSSFYIFVCLCCCRSRSLYSVLRLCVSFSITLSFSSETPSTLNELNAYVFGTLAHAYAHYTAIDKKKLIWFTCATLSCFLAPIYFHSHIKCCWMGIKLPKTYRSTARRFTLK